MRTHRVRVERSSKNGRIAICDDCGRQSTLTGVHNAVSRAMDRLDVMAKTAGQRVVHVTGLTTKPEQPTVKT
jgi:ribosomal protein L34E